MIVMLTTTIEMEQFVVGNSFEGNTLRNFIYFPYLGVYPLFIINLIIFFELLFIRGKRKCIKKYKTKQLSKVRIWVTILIISSLVSTAITIIINDNNIATADWYFSKLLTEIYKYLMLFLIINNTALILIKYNYRRQMSQLFAVLLISSGLSSFASVISGFHGYYAYLENVLLLSLFSFFSILVVLLSPYFSSKLGRIFTLVLGISVFVLMLQFSSPLGGKWFFVVFILLGFYILKYYSKLTYRKLISFIIVIFFIFTAYLLVDNLDLNNMFLELKFQQFLESINIFSPNWYSNLSASPKFRIDEFVNISIEYFEKPYFFFFGKGIGGTITQHTNILDWTGRGAFPIEQAVSGIFLDMHESINILYLKNGFLGILFFIWVLKTGLKNINDNPFIGIGLIWFVFFWGVYSSLLVGLSFLVLGLSFIEVKETNNLEVI